MTQAEAREALNGKGFFKIENGEVLLRDAELIRLYQEEVERRSSPSRLGVSNAGHHHVVSAG